MKVSHIVGADLSKKTIDLVYHANNCHHQIENTTSGFRHMIKWLKQMKIDLSELMIVMEHTGLYSYCFEQFLHGRAIAFTKVNALVIKRSMGLVRGKSDKIDAARIAAYGYEKKEKLVAESPRNKGIDRLQLLYSTRKQLIKQKAALTCSVKEYRNIGIAGSDLIIRSQTQIIKDLEKQINRLEKEMKAIIDADVSTKNNYALLLTIKGVGKVLAWATIIKTNNFTLFDNARKFACFCGTAPFEHTSGTSIRKRTKVSHVADKQMKTLLDLSAKSAIQFDKELHDFYTRRIKDGKSKMSTINIVRNKILYRMFAIIKRQSPFVDNYLTAA